jgi:2-methylcitrate dehydratase
MMIDYDVRVSPSKAALNRADQLARPNKTGASVFGVPATSRVTPEWAASADGIRTGANDPKKMQLDHALISISAVALQDGSCHLRDSRPDTAPPCRMIETTEHAESKRRYRATDPNERSFGDRVEIFQRNGSKLEDEMAVAAAHPLGAERDDNIRKFQTLTDGIISSRCFEAAQELPRLPAGELHRLTITLPAGTLEVGKPGIL